MWLKTAFESTTSPCCFCLRKLSSVVCSRPQRPANSRESFFSLNSAKNWYQFCWIYHVVPFLCRFQRKFAKIFMWTKQWTRQFFAEIGENRASNCNYSESSENLQKFNGIRDMWDFFWKPSELAELFENVHLGRLFLIAEIFAEFGEIKEPGREFFFQFFAEISDNLQPFGESKNLETPKKSDVVDSKAVWIAVQNHLTNSTMDFLFKNNWQTVRCNSISKQLTDCAMEFLLEQPTSCLLHLLV